MLLNKFFKEDSKLGKQYVRVYSSTAPTEVVANKLYRRLGFAVLGEEPTKWPGIKYIYWQLKIR